MTIFYILWKSIDAHNTYTKDKFPKNSLIGSLDSELIHDNESRKTSFISMDIRYRNANQFTIDCGKSTTGLFLGIFTLLCTIISLITYLIYKEHNQKSAIILSEVTELCLIFLSLFVVILVYIELKYYKFDHKVG